MLFRSFDQEIDYPMDRDHEGDERRPRDHYRGDHDRPVETRTMDSDNDRDKENSKGYDSERDKDKEQPPRKRFRYCFFIVKAFSYAKLLIMSLLGENEILSFIGKF